MTKDEALKLALEALEDNQHLIADNERHAYVMEYNGIIEKCKEALAQPEQEPFGWIGKSSGVFIKNVGQRQVDGTALYTTPPQRTWAWLSSEEEKQIKDNCTTVACVLKAVKAKLKEKNT